MNRKKNYIFIIFVLIVVLFNMIFNRSDFKNDLNITFEENQKDNIENTNQKNSEDNGLDTASENSIFIDKQLEEDSDIDENGKYYSKDDVALYLHIYGKLPSNYLKKSEAQELGWESSEGNLWEVTDKGVIGGDRFGNREGILPEDEIYFEADVNYNGGYRGSERLVYTKKGKVIYYTGNHYETFEVLYE